MLILYIAVTVFVGIAAWRALTEKEPAMNVYESREASAWPASEYRTVGEAEEDERAGYPTPISGKLTLWEERGCA